MKTLNAPLRLPAHGLANWVHRFAMRLFWTRSDAENQSNADLISRGRLVYLSDGSPLHLRSVLKDSLVWRALVDAWRSGAAIAGSSAGATVLGDPMVDPRGGTFTLGLGLIRNFAAVPHWEMWTGDRARRMSHLTPRGAVVAEIEEETALVRWSDGTWQALGTNSVVLKRNGETIGLGDVEETIETVPGRLGSSALSLGDCHFVDCDGTARRAAESAVVFLVPGQ